MVRVCDGGRSVCGVGGGGLVNANAAPVLWMLAKGRAPAPA